MKKLNSLILLLLLTCCAYKQEENKLTDSISSKDLTAREIIDKVLSKTNPDKKLESANSVIIDFKDIKMTNDNERTDYLYKFLYDKEVDLYAMSLKKIIRSHTKRKTGYIECSFRDGSFKRGYSENIDVFEKSELNFLPDYTRYFIDDCFFALNNNKFLKLTKGAKKVRVNGKLCYKINALLPEMYYSLSNKLTYYIDNKNFTLEKITYDNWEVEILNQKIIDGINVFTEYTHTKNGLNPETWYSEMIKFEINKKIDLKGYFRELEIGREL